MPSKGITVSGNGSILVQDSGQITVEMPALVPTTTVDFVVSDDGIEDHLFTHDGLYSVNMGDMTETELKSHLGVDDLSTVQIVSIAGLSLPDNEYIGYHSEYTTGSVHWRIETYYNLLQLLQFPVAIKDHLDTLVPGQQMRIVFASQDTYPPSR